MLNVATPADLRALFARERIPVYLVAAQIPMHPSRLSAILNERAALSPELAEQIVAAVSGLRTAGPA